MKVFVGWPYEADWIKQYPIPLIESYGVEVLTGEELAGQILTDGVKDKIDQAHACVFFTLRRGEQDDNSWKTSDWVVDEIKHANSIEKRRILEVREEGVSFPNKITEERQYIVYKKEDPMKTLVELGKTISRWHGQSLKLQLLPQEFVMNIRKRLGSKNYNCCYIIKRFGQVIHGPVEAEIHREGHGMYLYAYDLPSSVLNQLDALIEVTVDIGDQWSSTGMQLGVLDVNLEKI